MLSDESGTVSYSIQQMYAKIYLSKKPVGMNVGFNLNL